jgi:hypothetical protein
MLPCFAGALNFVKEHKSKEGRFKGAPQKHSLCRQEFHVPQAYDTRLLFWPVAAHAARSRSKEALILLFLRFIP